MGTAEIQASLQSPLFSRQVEGGDCLCHSDLISASPVTLLFFFTLQLCAETLFLLYFEPKPNLSKTLEGLLMRLVFL